MAVNERSQSATTGADTNGDLRKRNVPQGQQNGSYIPQAVDEKLDEKSKQKVRHIRLERSEALESARRIELWESHC